MKLSQLNDILGDELLYVHTAKKLSRDDIARVQMSTALAKPLLDGMKLELQYAGIKSGRNTGLKVNTLE